MIKTIKTPTGPKEVNTTPGQCMQCRSLMTVTDADPVYRCRSETCPGGTPSIWHPKFPT